MTDESVDNDNDLIIEEAKKLDRFVLFFKLLANRYFGGFIGKDLVTGEKRLGRLVHFIMNVFFLIIKSLPIALFVSYFLITLPTWLFVLAIVLMICELGGIAICTEMCYKNRIHLAAKKVENNKEQAKNSAKKVENNKEQAKNHAKFYKYNDKYYKNIPTPWISDFFRYIGDVYFGGFFGKIFLSGEYLNNKTKKFFAYLNIVNIISDISLWMTVVLCFLMTVPTWLFVLAIVVAAKQSITSFRAFYIARRNSREELRKDLFFCKYEMQGENKWLASLEQVPEKNRYNGIPKCEYINENDVKNCSEISFDD